jgi:hypothetical protein
MRAPARAAVPSPPLSDERPAAGRRPNPYRHADRPAVPLLLTVHEAAEALRTTPDGLRARLRRAQVAGNDGTVTAPLGPGIVGIKVGTSSWRVRFDAT